MRWVIKAGCSPKGKELRAAWSEQKGGKSLLCVLREKVLMLHGHEGAERGADRL